MDVVLEVLAVLLLVTGPIWVLVSAVAMWRLPDALSRINALGPATGLGLTSIVLGGWLHHVAVDGFSIGGLVKAVVTVAALLLVSSVASNTLARAAVLSGARTHPATSPNDLEDPGTT